MADVPKRDPLELELIYLDQEKELLQKKLTLKQTVLDKKRAEQTVRNKIAQEKELREIIKNMQMKLQESAKDLGINTTEEED
jgi:hypothetical protein